MRPLEKLGPEKFARFAKLVGLIKFMSLSTNNLKLFLKTVGFSVFLSKNLLLASFQKSRSKFGLKAKERADPLSTF